MGAPARFPSGVTNVVPTSPLAQYGLPDPSSWHTYFNDFDEYAVADWVLTTTELGTGSATEAITDEDGGVLLITNDNADNDNDFFQLVGETFRFTSGKRLIFKARFQVSDATQSDVVMGLQIRDTSPLAVSDGVFFRKDDNAAVMNFITCLNNTEVIPTLANTTLANATYVEVAFYYDGKSSLLVFVDGVAKADAGVANLVTDEDLTVSFGVQNGDANARSMKVDYIFVAKER